MKVVVLSLAGAVERRARFAEHVPSDCMQWDFFDAHTGLSDALVYDRRRAMLAKGRELRPGELGCYSSHFGIWQQLLDDDESEGYIVLEDDVVADWSFLRALTDYDPATHGLDYLRLYFKHTPRFSVLQRHFVRRSTSLIEIMDPAFGTQAYFVSKAGARRLVSTSQRVFRPVDDQMDRFWDHGLANISVFPFPVFERMGESEIGSARFSPEGRNRAWLLSGLYRGTDRVKKRLAIARRTRKARGGRR